MNCICKICGNSNDNKIYQIKERRINKGEDFEYILCSNCGVLALNESVRDMYRYYTNQYYSFQIKKSHLPWAARKIRNIIFKGIIAGFFPPQIAEIILNKRMQYASCLYNTHLPTSSKILDIGGVRDNG